MFAAYASSSDDDDAPQPQQQQPQSQPSSSASQQHQDAPKTAPGSAAKSQKRKRRVVNTAPDVSTGMSSFEYQVVDPNAAKIDFNPTADQIWRPLQGPTPPHGAQQQPARTNHLMGHVEESHLDAAAFEMQMHTFQRYGYAHDPAAAQNTAKHGTASVVGDRQKFAELGGLTSIDAASTHDRKRARHARKQRKKEQAGRSDPSDVDGFQGPWAPDVRDKAIEPPKELTDVQKKIIAGDKARDRERARRQRAARRKRGEEVSDTDESEGDDDEDDSADSDASEHDSDDDDDDEKTSRKAKKKQKNKNKSKGGETSTLHLAELYDYQGRSYLHPPSDTPKQAPTKCRPPQKKVHTFKGHSKGVSAIRWFPNSGHLLLSSSMDSTIRLWSTIRSARRLVRTFEGHSAAVRDVCFSADGTRLVSTSYDKYVKHWDTETGQCISRHTTRAMPWCVQVYPEDANQVLVGQGNKKIVQWDLRANEVAQEYDDHLGAVNAIQFFDSNRRFVSSADDKKLLVWEYGLPVVVRQIAEPEQHSMPFIAMHPSEKFFVGQSQDNQALAFQIDKGFRQKKKFRGHLCAGYAAQLDFSPNGKFLISGDSQGRMFVWDFATSRIVKKLKCHSQVTIGATWHPRLPSTVATCSWDGDIHIWQ